MDVLNRYLHLPETNRREFRIGLSPREERLLDQSLADLVDMSTVDSVGAADVPFFNDPVGWIGHNLPQVDLGEYQNEILDAVPKHNKVAARGPRGLGKTTIAALIILWFAHTREQAGIDWKAVITSGSHYQLGAYLWPEVHKWARAANLGWTSEQLLKRSIQLTHGAAVSASPERAELIEGAHATQVLVVFDEAKSIPEATFNAIEGVFSNIDDDSEAQGFAVAVSTPGHPSGEFYNIHTQRHGYNDWWTRHVTITEAVTASRVTQKWADNLKQKWGQDSTWYANHVEGEFRASDENSVIPLAWVEAAMERWRDLQAEGFTPPVCTSIGIDIARHGQDQTIFAPKHGTWYGELQRLPRQDLAETGGDIATILRQNPYATGIIDADGMGAGVYDFVRKAGHKVEAFFGAPKPEYWVDTSGMLKAFNTRSAAWWDMRQLLNPTNPDPIALPPDDELLGDLTAPQLAKNLKGDIKLEEKAQTKKRIGRSPDAGDAVVYATWEGVHVDEFSGSESWENERNQTNPIDWTVRP